MPRRLSNQAYPFWMGLVPEKTAGLSQKGHGATVAAIRLRAIACAVCAHLDPWHLPLTQQKFQVIVRPSQL